MQEITILLFIVRQHTNNINDQIFTFESKIKKLILRKMTFS